MRVQDAPSPRDLHAPKNDATSDGDGAAIPLPAPRVETHREESRALVPVDAPTPPVVIDSENGALVDPALVDELTEGGDRNLRHISPREIHDLALDLYAHGMMTFEDYAVLAFQPELHPDYDATVGALTGERASPDRPRDYVQLWEDRLIFERRHHPENAPLVAQTHRIAALLKQLDNPTDIEA